jgi:hypothetical protein
MKIIWNASCTVVQLNKQIIVDSMEKEMLVVQESEGWYRILAPEYDYRLIP